MRTFELYVGQGLSSQTAAASELEKLVLMGLFPGVNHLSLPVC